MTYITDLVEATDALNSILCTLADAPRLKSIDEMLMENLYANAEEIMNFLIDKIDFLETA